MVGGPQANDTVDAESFYARYLPRLYGREAAPLLTEAYRLLEERERDLGDGSAVGRGLPLTACAAS